MSTLLIYYIMITKGNVKIHALFLKYNFLLLLEELTEVAKLSMVS